MCLQIPSTIQLSAPFPPSPQPHPPLLLPALHSAGSWPVRHTPLPPHRIAIDALDGPEVHGAQVALRQAVVDLVIRRHGAKRVRQRLQLADGAGVGLNVHVQLKAVVLAAEQRLLVLVLAHELRGAPGVWGVSQHGVCPGGRRG
jgi:hypothetical protein